MIKKVVFFNYYHNGDIHVSRGLVKAISNICAQNGIICEYYHKNDPGILADIKNVTYTSNPYHLHDRYPSTIAGEILFFNTWYCANMNIFNSYTISFDCLYLNFKEPARWLGIDLETIHGLDLFPNIDFECFDIAKAKKWLANNNRPRVFISNGNVLSGQSNNFSFSGIINELAKSYDYIDFLVSNTEPGHIPMPNVFLTSDIIQKNGFDLNENAYLASHCQLIIGRCSGAYSFAINRYNYWDSPKTFLAFTNMGINEVRWTTKFTPPVGANIIAHNIFDHRVIDIIRKELPAK